MGQNPVNGQKRIQDTWSRVMRDLAFLRDVMNETDLSGDSVDTRFQHAFYFCGNVWTMTFDGKSIQMSDRVGYWYIRALLAQPRQGFGVWDLTRSDHTPRPGVDVVAGEAPRERGKLSREKRDKRFQTFQVELRELESARADANKTGDDETTRRIDQQIYQLKQDFFFCNKTISRVIASSVTKEIRRAINSIAKKHPTLAEHLALSITRGYPKKYFPDRMIAWRIAN